jgi:AraC-like DNA-binding protein
MRQGNDIQLTHIAQEFGYFDQSYFIREFKAFSGVTPKTFLSDNNISFVEI